MARLLFVVLCAWEVERDDRCQLSKHVNVARVVPLVKGTPRPMRNYPYIQKIIRENSEFQRKQRENEKPANNGCSVKKNVLIVIINREVYDG